MTTSTPTAALLDGPQKRFVTDGGLETTLVFLEGIDLPEFASFPLLYSAEGRDALTRYFGPYLDIAQERATGIVLDTPTWRANPDWGTRLGYDRDALILVNHRGVEFVRGLAAVRPGLQAVVNGVVGPRGDGYVVGEMMSAAEAASYHSLQIRALADAGADLVSAVTMTNVEEAIGVTEAAAASGLPVVIGFTVETDGRLPSGAPLGEAIEATDRAVGIPGAPAWYMINCAHPSHFADALSAGAPWVERVKSIRANASRMSHAELDAAPELDRGDPDELASDYQQLARLLPDLRVVGGCCGTDHDHIARISRAVV